MEDLQRQIDQLKHDVEVLRNRSVHNQMTYDTRKNIVESVVPGVGYLTVDNLGLETNYSTLQVFNRNIPYNVMIAPTDPVTGTNSIGIIAGAGVPTLSLPKGTIYIQTDASTTITRLYIAKDAIGGWTSIPTTT